MPFQRYQTFIVSSQYICCQQPKYDFIYNVLTSNRYAAGASAAGVPRRDMNPLRIPIQPEHPRLSERLDHIHRTPSATRRRSGSLVSGAPAWQTHCPQMIIREPLLPSGQTASRRSGSRAATTGPSPTEPALQIPNDKTTHFRPIARCAVPPTLTFPAVLPIPRPARERMQGTSHAGSAFCCLARPSRRSVDR